MVLALAPACYVYKLAAHGDVNYAILYSLKWNNAREHLKESIFFRVFPGGSGFCQGQSLPNSMLYMFPLQCFESIND